jgi:hypothetical protein
MIPFQTNQHRGGRFLVRDIFKRQVKDFLSSRPDRDRPSPEDELRDHAREEWREALQDAADPGRREREDAERAAELEEVRSQKGTGQPVRLDGYPGEWEAVGLVAADETAVTLELVDRVSGAFGQIGATDDGSVVLDVPDDQFSTRGVAGALSYSPTTAGVRLDAVELSSDQRRVKVTCDLRADIPLD